MKYKIEIVVIDDWIDGDNNIHYVRRRKINKSPNNININTDTIIRLVLLCSPYTKLPNPPIKIGIIIKEVVNNPWNVIIGLYCGGGHKIKPGEVNSILNIRGKP